MRFLLLFYTFLLISASSLAQEDFYAKQYYSNGDFEKAVVFYEKLVEKNPRRTDYAEALIACYQQLERYTDAEIFLNKQLNQARVIPTFYVELGYNHTLQNAPEKATKHYDSAIAAIEKNANYGYAVGLRFEKYALLDYAIKAYSTAMGLNEKLNYSYQLARVYGEQGNIEKMYRAYISLIIEEKSSMSNVLRRFDDFVTADPENENNIILKTILLEGAQKNPNLRWNELLSWLFVQQKQYSSAFRQEKAIFKRKKDNNWFRLDNLAGIALEEDTAVAGEMYRYIVDNTEDDVTRLNAQLNLIDIQLLEPSEKVLEKVEKQFEELLKELGYKTRTLQLQVAYANFLTFKKDTSEPAIDLLKKCLDLPLNNRGEALVKLALGDILVFNKKFNEALIYFSQVQKSMKNDILGQDARYKVAQTSFYKGDFDWALTQLKVLRSSTSQLIANDAMQLSLLISDNILEDSTQTALKKYARADLLAYQNKPRAAISELDGILENHKGEKIEDEALLKQGELLESLEDHKAAEFNYIKIIEFYSNGILADDAHFALGELYRNTFNEPEKAKGHYEKIIYNFQDSYYFPQARRHFRKLRGDAIN
jgi:tetratricopeptide (TPR) repeat protein